MNKEMIDDLLLLQVQTTQKSKTFYYLPENGWKRGEEYHTLESEVISEIQKEISNNVLIIKSSSRYFEFYVSANNTDDTDQSTEIREAVEIMFKVAEKYKLKLLTAV